MSSSDSFPRLNWRDLNRSPEMDRVNDDTLGNLRRKGERKGEGRETSTKSWVDG